MRKKIKNEELNRLSTEAFKRAVKMPVVIVLDNVRSLNNVGSAFRTGDAFLVEKLYLTGITGKPPHRDINKTALGATDSVDWEYREDVVELVRELKANEYQTVAIEQVSSSKPLDQFGVDPEKRYALIFGNEIFGVNEAVVNEADECLEIPQYGTKHSLNISVAIGVVLWEFAKNYKVVLTQ